MIRFPLVAEGLQLLLVASPPISQLLSFADLAVYEAEGFTWAAALLGSGRQSCPVLVVAELAATCAWAVVGAPFLAAQSWQEKGKFSMSWISACNCVKISKLELIGLKSEIYIYEI